MLNTITVIMMAITPSLNASSRPFFIPRLYNHLAIRRRCTFPVRSRMPRLTAKRQRYP